MGGKKEKKKQFLNIVKNEIFLKGIKGQKKICFKTNYL